ncbi:dihydrofolate reductase-like [Mya arenaria]|uniref:dihydrofolate reductase-like n=1 Tax=Mya arenaria TaxID=6604 RepID=UPI0022DED0D1|nr:dihydrofolate reductase-like [Mya arenaria]
MTGDHCIETDVQGIVPHESLLKVVGSFEESLVFIDELAETECVDSVWIMGGSHLYQESLAHPRCRKLYLTHVNTDFQSDTYFPEFENGFKEIPNDVSDITRHEENGVSFDFKLYERMSS